MRPLKIGTPNSMHLAITSRRSRPASRASSVGVRWMAIGGLSFAGALHVLKYASKSRRRQHPRSFFNGVEALFVRKPRPVSGRRGGAIQDRGAEAFHRPEVSPHPTRVQKL